MLKILSIKYHIYCYQQNNNNYYKFVIYFLLIITNFNLIKIMITNRYKLNIKILIL